jgi:hypothetical protein
MYVGGWRDDANVQSNRYNEQSRREQYALTVQVNDALKAKQSTLDGLMMKLQDCHAQSAPVVQQMKATLVCVPPPHFLPYTCAVSCGRRGTACEDRGRMRAHPWAYHPTHYYPAALAILIRSTTTSGGTVREKAFGRSRSAVHAQHSLSMHVGGKCTSASPAPSLWKCRTGSEWFSLGRARWRRSWRTRRRWWSGTCGAWRFATSASTLRARW